MTNLCRYRRICQQEVEALVPPSSWLPLLNLWEKELVNGREGKMTAKNSVDLILNVDQTKGFIIFITSKVAGEYKTIYKTFVLFIT